MTGRAGLALFTVYLHKIHIFPVIDSFFDSMRKSKKGVEIFELIKQVLCFTVHFLAIHPFQDGNGRLSRVLTTMLLLQNGYLFVSYSAMEAITEQNKEVYYLALRKAQSTLNLDYKH